VKIVLAETKFTSRLVDRRISAETAVLTCLNERDFGEKTYRVGKYQLKIQGVKMPRIRVGMGPASAGLGCGLVLVIPMAAIAIAFFAVAKTAI